MTQTELVNSIGETLTSLDNALMEPALIAQPAKWQQTYAMRKHLDDQQRLLVAQQFDADDADFKSLTETISAATVQLKKVIANMAQIDKILNAVAVISADLDQILTAI